MRFPGYLEQIDDGTIQPRARPQIVRGTRATVVVDGNRGFGQLAARTATLAALEKVREQGSSRQRSPESHMSATGRVCRARGGGALHRTRVRELRTARRSRRALWRRLPPSGHEPARLRHSGRDEAADRFRFLDRVSNRRSGAAVLEAKKQLPEGWILDAQGNPSIQPGDLYKGGSLLPAAGHKGFGLGLLVEILGGVLAGAGCA